VVFFIQLISQLSSKTNISSMADLDELEALIEAPFKQQEQRDSEVSRIIIY